MKTKFPIIKRYSRWLLVAAASVFTPGAAANELANSGFENGTTAWKLQNNHDVVNSNARSGSRSLQLTSNGALGTTLSNVINANAGDEFVYSAWVKALNLVAEPNGFGDTPLTVLRFRNGSGFVFNSHGNLAEGYRWAPYQPDGTYPYTKDGMDMRFEMPPEGTGFQVGVRTWTHNKSGKTWWDDLSVTKLEFPDRGAEAGTYQAESANSITKAITSSSEKHFTGSGYIDVTGNNSEVTWTNVVGGGERVLSFRYSWEGFVRQFTVFVNGQQVGSEKPVATGRRGIWATRDFNVTLPSGNNTVMIRIGKAGGPLGQPMLDRMKVYVRSGTGGGNPPPPSAPDAPSNLTASDSEHTDRVSVSWNASSNADDYELYRNTSTSGQGTNIYSGGATSFNDTSATPATAYQYRVRACNSAGCGGYSAWEAGSRADAGGGGSEGGGGGEPPPNGNGSISGMTSGSNSIVDISNGTADWLKLGETEVRKANSTQQISAVTGIGSTNGLPYRFAKRGHSWFDGTPTVSATNNRGGLRVFNNGKGLMFSVAASTTPRTLSFWISGAGTSAEDFELAISASLSDGSASPFTTQITKSGTGIAGQRIDVTYASEGSDETIDVELLKNGGNYFSLDAIMVTGGDAGTADLPPTLASIANQTITEGDSLHVDIDASDPEGSDITLSMVSELPRGGDLTDSGNGIGAIDWDSQVGDAGNWEVTVTARDSANNSASETFNVMVQPQVDPGTNGSLSVDTSIVNNRNVTLGPGFVKYAPTTSLNTASDSLGSELISPMINLGDAIAGRGTSGKIRYSYGGGTPGNNVKGGNRVFNEAPKGMRIEIDASQIAGSSRVYLAVYNVLARAVVALSDGSAPQQVVEIDRRNKSLQTFAIDIDHTSAAANQKVIVELFVAETADSGPTGWIQLEAAEDRSNF